MGFLYFRDMQRSWECRGGQIKLPQLVGGRGGGAGQGTDMADPLEKSHVFTPGEFTLLLNPAGSVEAWDGSWGPCTAGPHHHTHGDRMQLQLSKGKKREKKIAGEKKGHFP